MKIIVTGGAGFIGSHVAKALLQMDNQIAIVDNLDNYYSLKLKQYNLEELKKIKAFNLYTVDIRNKEELEKVVGNEKPDVIIHLAAKAGVRPSIEFPEEYFSVNVNGTLNILQAAKKNNVEKVLIASSSSVYGTNKKVPFSEADPVNNQISPYAASKRSLEVLCSMYSQVYGINIQLFRFFTVYGPSGRPDMAPAIFTRLIMNQEPLSVYGSLETERDYTYIDDIVVGILKALERNDKYEIYNLGNNKPIKLYQLISEIESNVGEKASINILSPQKGDVERTWANIDKAERSLGYSPQTSLKEGIKKYVEWYRNNQELY